MVAAVSAVAVAMTSCLRAPARLQSARSWCAKAGAELFAAAGLRRRGREVGRGEEAVEDGLEDATARGDGAVLVEAAVVELLHEQVDEDVGGAGIEGEDVGGGAGRGQCGDVGDAAEVEQHAILCRVAEEAEVEHGDQRRALASGGEIGGAEVADDGDAQAFGEQRGLADLRGAADRRAEKLCGRGLVIDRLAMHRGKLRLEVELARGRRDAVGVEFAETPGELAQFGGRGLVRRRRC